MKKLLIVTSGCFPGGSASANLLRLMGAGLTEEGWTVEVLIQRGLLVDDKTGIPARTGEKQGVAYRFCGFRRRPKSVILKFFEILAGNIMTLSGIARSRFKNGIDTVLVYNSSGVECAFLLLVCKLLRLKTMAYISEWYEKQSVVRRWYRILNWWDFVLRMRGVNPLFDGLVMPSHFLFNYYRDKKNMPESRLYILPNLVDTACFENAAADLRFPKHGVRIGYCGTPTRKDGAEDLIRAFALACETNSAIELLIIGGRAGDAELLDGLRHLAEDLSVADRIIFTGLVPFQHVPALLRSCDILALARPAGVFAEAGFPTKLGEYMACRKPVVLTKVGDLPRYLTHRKNAILAEPDNPEDFARQILWLIDHPEDADQIAAAGYRWTAEMLGYKKAAATFSGFLQSI